MSLTLRRLVVKMKKAKLLKTFKGLNPGDFVWVMFGTNKWYTIWKNPNHKVYLGCARIDSDLFEIESEELVQCEPFSYRL